MAVVRSHSLSVGIVGLPNSGKSTLFNSLTECAVPAENFPFCTIDKNVGVVKIPDARLERMSEFFKAEKTVPSAITFVDIAGLVKGASQGEGLGNQFLAHIREVDVIMYVLRAFGGDKVVHVYNRVDPLEDLKIVESELILKDIETVQKRLGDLKRGIKSGLDEKIKLAVDTLEKMLVHLGDGKMAVTMPMNDKEQEVIADLWLLTNKRCIYVLNVREGVSESDLEKWVGAVKEYVPAQDKDFVMTADVKVLGELSGMSIDERAEYLEMLGGNPAIIDDVINLAYKRLGLVTFYTGSEKECNAWTIEGGATAQEAAGAIHTDLAKNFITADVVNVDGLVEAGGWAEAKEKGLVRSQGKDYVVKDGDYMIVHVTGGK